MTFWRNARFEAFEKGFVAIDTWFGSNEKFVIEWIGSRGIYIIQNFHNILLLINAANCILSLKMHYTISDVSVKQYVCCMSIMQFFKAFLDIAMFFFHFLTLLGLLPLLRPSISFLVKFFRISQTFLQPYLFELFAQSAYHFFCV